MKYICALTLSAYSLIFLILLPIFLVDPSGTEILSSELALIAAGVVVFACERVITKRVDRFPKTTLLACIAFVTMSIYIIALKEVYLSYMESSTISHADATVDDIFLIGLNSRAEGVRLTVHASFPKDVTIPDWSFVLTAENPTFEGAAHLFRMVVPSQSLTIVPAVTNGVFRKGVSYIINADLQFVGSSPAACSGPTCTPDPCVSHEYSALLTQLEQTRYEIEIDAGAHMLVPKTRGAERPYTAHAYSPHEWYQNAFIMYGYCKS
ncbi:MAG TPA: hypothetical protein VM103_01940 [Candidatus Paceibacterota bacterium]|nr:hypothetical protein [Candidatus Paceibacterota bacterium]